ncbi:Hypothetical protein R9X50_00310700 [Acrodontium crateriforme]|uniref:MHD domain-containing protein n=1 Tax=Acrodontium crateriforme TaxID=150365 RepID=A0AAQ3RBK0_9PEZI|nr:Hypothetical protein R9X50_00310700 [Acrodontium crateriforme]
MDRTDYPAMLPSLQPGQAVDILNERVRQVGKLNTAIADWLQERRRLEEQYSNGLRRLAREKLDGVDLGVFSVPWTTITGSADTLADSHSALANKIEVDVERPLRDFVSTSREMQGMTTIQGNLASMAKDVEKNQQKADRLKSKGDETKASNADSDLNNAISQWESQAPYVFENLQAVDESRLNHLRDVLTQFQTHEVDQVEKSRQTAEHCLNILLQVETLDEIKTFVLKCLTLADKPRSQQPQAITSRPPLTQDLFSPSRSTTENESQRSGSIQEDKRKSRFGGLKRLGTVMRSSKDSDRRKSKIPTQLAPMAESPESSDKTRSSPFSAGRRFGRRDSTTNLEPPKSSAGRPSSPLRMGSDVLEPPSPLPGADPSSPSPVRRSEEPSRVNGTAAAAGVSGFAAGRAGAVATAAMLNGHQNDLADLEPPTLSPPKSQGASSAVLEPTKDSEGFSVPPADLDPITQAQREAASFEGEPGSNTPPAFNVNIRDKPIQDENADAALSSAATKLQAPPSVMPRSSGTLRGRRAGRPSSMLPPEQSFSSSDSFSKSTTAPIAEAQSPPASPPSAGASRAMESAAGQSPSTFAQSTSSFFAPATSVGSGVTSFSPTGNPASPIRPDTRMISPDVTGDNQSIRSGRSTASQGIKHPEFQESGLSASIVETVSAKFEDGKPVSSTLIGEIALAYNPTNFSSPFGSESIRLEKFSSLEKVAPNPAFITHSQSQKEGEFSVNLASIARTQVAFKYQLKNTGSETYAPLMISPAFRLEPTQASVIVSYSLNPTFNLQGKESITLSNVMLALTLEGATATSCQSRPAGTFARERNLIYWQLGEITIKAGAPAQKLLARFTTESEAKNGTVEARWEIAGENVNGLGSGLQVSMHSSSGTGAADGSDPFADQEGASSAWKNVPGSRKLLGGSYIAK